MELKNTISSGLSKHNIIRSSKELGNRFLYIGASEISGCLRSTVLKKLGKGKKPDFQTLLRYERGHLAEDMIASAFKAEKVEHKRQVEAVVSIVECADCGLYYTPGEIQVCKCGLDPLTVVPVKCHIDFLLEGNHIVECKAPNGIPSLPYDDWEVQLNTQLMLCRMAGIAEKLTGSIVALDVGSATYEEFNGYSSDNNMFDDWVMTKALNIWMAVRDGQTDNLEASPGLLCGCCDFLADCPKFDGEMLPEFETQIVRYRELKDKVKQMDQEAKKLSSEMVKVLKPYSKKWFEAGGKKFRVQFRTTNRTDMLEVAKALAKNGDTIENYKSSSTSYFLEVK